jgi:hypothetical protein
MSLFSKLFGGAKSNAQTTKAKPEIYEGFSIYAEPASESGGYRICARIEKEIDGALKSHRMIRADTLGSIEAAKQASIDKARMMIDQMGDAVFR